MWNFVLVVMHLGSPQRCNLPPTDPKAECSSNLKAL
jgi:hypothetical protein